MNQGIFARVDQNQRIPIWISIITLLSSRIDKWYVDCLDCLNESKLSRTAYTSAELVSVLSLQPDIFSARMVGTTADRPLVLRIRTREDYLKSNCQCIDLCTDGIYFEIFSKDRKLLIDLFSRLKRAKVNELSWIEDDFGGRRDFCI